METFTATFLVVFRESFEAALIVGIVLTVLVRLGVSKYTSHVLASSAAAVAASFALAFLYQWLTHDLREELEGFLEAGISVVACGVLTHMIFWMEKQGRRIQSEIEQKVREAVVREEYLVLVSLPFFAVFREGAETVLFLGAVAIQHSQAVSWVGGVAGVTGALVLAWLLFFAGKRVPLKAFFRGTGVLLLLIGGGLLAYGIHEFQEMGHLPFLEQTAWDLNPFLNEKEGFGAFLKAVFGYNGNPSVLEVLAYFSYFVIILTLLRSFTKQAPQRA